MGHLGAQSSLAASVQSFGCQFNQHKRFSHDSASSLALPRVSFPASKKSVFSLRSQDGQTEQGTDKASSSSKVEKEQGQEVSSSKLGPSSPFAGGKISSRLTTGKALQQREASTASSPPSVLDSSDKTPSPSSPFSSKSGSSDSGGRNVPFPNSSPFKSSSAASPFASNAESSESCVPFPNSSPFKSSAAASPFSNKAGASSSTEKSAPFPNSGPSKSSASSKSAKAFPAPPAVSSPFDSRKPPPRRRSTADIDERILASRKEILDTLWRERRQQPRMNAAPADIFDDPKPLESDKEYKFELIRGTKPIVLIISFSIIVAIMFGTAFIAWKLGAFHYDEY